MWHGSCNYKVMDTATSQAENLSEGEARELTAINQVTAIHHPLSLFQNSKKNNLCGRKQI